MTHADLKQYDRVVFTGPTGLFESVERKDIGYIIEIYDEDSFEVEFSHKDGATYATHVIPSKYLNRV